MQPIIRYDLGDSVTVVAEPCTCGSLLAVIRVEGRSGDILALAAPNGETIRVLPLAIGSEAEEVAGVRRVQIIQVGPSTLLVKLEPEAGSDRGTVTSQVQHRLAAFRARQGLANIVISVSPELPRAEPSGKFRQVYRQSTA